jgi:hypothetical protein
MRCSKSVLEILMSRILTEREIWGAGGSLLIFHMCPSRPPVIFHLIYLMSNRRFFTIIVITTGSRTVHTADQQVSC